MLFLSTTFVYGARQLRSLTIDVDSEVVYPEIVSSHGIIIKITMSEFNHIQARFGPYLQEHGS